MDVVCFSHLRWNLVYQRPQHLLTQCSKIHRVFYIEEPLFDAESDYMEFIKEDNIWIIKLHLSGQPGPDSLERQEILIRSLFRKMNIENYLFWYYTPMALNFSRGFSPALTIYDCMDELSNFRFAPAELKEMELELMNQADIVFTGGKSLFEKKKHLHPATYCFPSSIDRNHFGKAQKILKEPCDQKDIPHPIIGYFGVIDERFNAELLKGAALLRPDWSFVIIGPVVKISENDLPKLPNIHYLGAKDYKILPRYLSGWDVAMIPFVIDESTEFISPTKTPEYLAAFKPVISTPITDVIYPYAEHGLISIVTNEEEFVKAAEFEFTRSENLEWRFNVSNILSQSSWESTFREMYSLINHKLFTKKLISSESSEYAE